MTDPHAQSPLSSGEVDVLHVVASPMSLQFLRGQLHYLQEAGVRYGVVCTPDVALSEFGVAEDVPVFGIPIVRHVSPMHDVVTLWKLVRLIRQLQPLIVHCHTPKAGLLGLLAGRITRRPVNLYHLRGLPYMTRTGAWRRFLQWIERVSCQLADEVLCVSDSIRDVAIADAICDASKVKVIAGGSGNGVDANGRFNPSRIAVEDTASLRNSLGIGDSETVIGFVGRLTHDKGVDDLLESWKLIRRQVESCHLVLVGEREQKDPIYAESVSLLTSDCRVHAVGHVKDTALWYALFDLVVLPSYREGLPNALLEAGAMALPAVTTAIPGSCEVVQDGVTGKFVPVADPLALSDAIVHYLRDMTLRKAHGNNARDLIQERFRQEPIWDGILREYVALSRSKGFVPAFTNSKRTTA
jgi:glycosyltransferase involved in cell wall biosynthesis